MVEVAAGANHGTVTAITVSLIVSNSITIHKLQSIIILPGKYWVKVVITLPVKHIRSQSGVELVGFSRETSKYSFIIHVEYLNGVAIEDIKTIGQGKVYYERRLFKFNSRELSKKQASITPKIDDIHLNHTSLTFYGVFQTLVNWYITKINSI